MKTLSLITGKVRDERRALEVAGNLVAMRERGLVDAIVFSTWVDELQGHPQLLQYLLQTGIQVIETDAQKVSVQESHQKIPILAALSLVDDDTYVTRHRFDRVMPDATFAAHLRRIKLDGPDPVADAQSPIGHRITVNSALVDVPLFFNDLVFSGMRADLCRLARLDLQAQLYWGENLNPEFAFWGTLFAGRFPALHDYLSAFPGIAYRNPLRRQVFRAVHQTSDFFARFFALHALVAHRYLQVGYAPPAVDTGRARIDLDRLLFSDDWADAASGLFYFGIAGHVAAKSSDLFGRIVDGQVEGSPFADKVLGFLGDFASQEPARSVKPLPPITQEALAYAQTLAARGIAGIGLPGLVHRTAHGLRFRLGQVMNDEAALSRNTAVQQMGEWERF